MTWPSLTQTGIRTSFRAELTLTPNQSAICVEIDLAGLLRCPHETFHSIDACHDAVQTAWQGIFCDAVHLENEKGRRF
jgi:hypothetical protein